MRVAVIILSCFGGLLMLDHTVIPMRLMALISSSVISSSERSHEVLGSLALFALWVGATALIFGFPGIAWKLFALLGIVGLYDGLTKDIEEFVFWGAIATGLAALTWLARREKRLADQVAWARTQHELAVHAALRSLHETVPELLIRSPNSDDSDPHLSGHVELRPRPAAGRVGTHR
jgi:hypothetical protein